MDTSHWQIDLWQQADLAGRRAMLELDEAEPTFLAGCATGEPVYLEGLTRVEADDLVAHALTIAMQRLESTVVIHPHNKRTPSVIIHAFASPAWLRELPVDQQTRLHGQLDGQLSGFFRTRQGSHSPWKSLIDQAELRDLTSASSITTVWNWAEMRNLADLTHAEEEWREMRIADEL